MPAEDVSVAGFGQRLQIEGDVVEDTAVVLITKITGSQREQLGFAIKYGNLNMVIQALQRLADRAAQFEEPPL